MNESKISVRYAKALFQLGKEKQLMDTIKEDMKLVFECCQTITDFWLMLESPVIKTSQKKVLIRQIFTQKVNEITLNFLDLVVNNKREVYLKDIARNFLSLYRVEQGIKSALLTSAVPVKEEEKKALAEMLRKFYDSEIELEEAVDENLIGGFVLRIEDQQLDVSVATQLERIKRELLSKRQFSEN